MKTKYIVILFLFFFSDVNADQYDPHLNDLFGQLQNYENQNEYDKIIKKIWNIWLKPEDIRIQEDFNKALFLIDKFQYNKSIIFLSNIIDKNPNFADFLSLLAQHGKDFFYRGDGAEIIDKFYHSSGYVNKQGLSDYKMKIREPLIIKIGKYTIVTNPAPSYGGTLMVFMLDLLKKSNQF